MDIAEETLNDEKAGTSRDAKQTESRPGPAEKEIKEFEEYLMDIGIRI